MTNHYFKVSLVLCIFKGEVCSFCDTNGLAELQKQSMLSYNRTNCPSVSRDSCLANSKSQTALTGAHEGMSQQKKKHATFNKILGKLLAVLLCVMSQQMNRTNTLHT